MRMMSVLTLAVLCAACASSSSSAGTFTRNIGNATAAETYEKVNRVLIMHQFEIEHEAGPPNIYFQTRWRDRAPDPDEAALGIEATQVRAIVRARDRGSSSEMGGFYNVQLTVEQRVRLQGSFDWTARDFSSSALEWAIGIEEDLRRELNVGVRRH